MKQQTKYYAFAILVYTRCDLPHLASFHGTNEEFTDLKNTIEQDFGYEVLIWSMKRIAKKYCEITNTLKKKLWIQK